MGNNTRRCRYIYRCSADLVLLCSSRFYAKEVPLFVLVPVMDPFTHLRLQNATCTAVCRVWRPRPTWPPRGLLLQKRTFHAGRAKRSIKPRVLGTNRIGPTEAERGAYPARDAWQTAAVLTACLLWVENLPSVSRQPPLRHASAGRPHRCSAILADQKTILTHDPENRT